ncbi:putative quinol monooxygenase [Undibacterium sp.]|uniref:putative quinol monooxygenase n=1 Tax=Undibacterium sp. TaxID=1914977 RepID=UPI00272F58CE|nr:antibiotic biosynthesis monooxygenase family protein [Undibacterium sp.]MDP1979116.1 antibiotic biosynthesis monooxygenase family protein [Undibacterium sp.]
MSEAFMMVILIQTKPGQSKEQIAVYTRLAPLVRAEAGCLQYDMHAVDDDEDKFVLVEKWTSKAALAAHDAMPYMVEADALSPSFRTGPATVLFLGPVIA